MRSEVTAGNICGQGGWTLEEGRSPSKPGKRGDVAQKTKKPGTECSSEPGQKALCIFGATGLPCGRGEETPETRQVTTTRPVKEKVPYCLTEVAYPQAKMMATIAKKPIHPIKLGFVPTIL